MNSICIIDALNNKRWVIPHTENKRSYGVLHREDGPAIECINGDKYWYINGKLHREDGPAVEFCNYNIVWYLNDEQIKPTNEMMSKYINLNPDNILKDYRYPLKIQLLAISLKQDVIFNIKYPNPKLKELYPKLLVLKDSGLI